MARVTVFPSGMRWPKKPPQSGGKSGRSKSWWEARCPVCGRDQHTDPAHKFERCQKCKGVIFDRRAVAA